MRRDFLFVRSDLPAGLCLPGAAWPDFRCLGLLNIGDIPSLQINGENLSEKIPLRADAHGTIRVGDTRVTRQSFNISRLDSTRSISDLMPSAVEMASDSSSSATAFSRSFCPVCGEPLDKPRTGAVESGCPWSCSGRF